MASTITPLLSHSPLLNRFKLNASFNGKTVTHVTQKSDLEAKQRRVEVKTVWKTEDRLGAGAFGVVWRQRAESGKLRAVKIIPKSQLNIQEVEALIELQDVCPAPASHPARPFCLLRYRSTLRSSTNG